MSALNEIPNEIFVEIISYLVFADLFNISSVSRRFHAVAEPLLYKQTSFNKLQTSASLSPLQRLLRTILSRPILASHVRSVDVKWRFQWVDHNRSPQSESDLEILTGAAKNIPLLSSLDTTGAQVVLLLHLLPNLRSLKLNPFLVPDVFDRFLEQFALLPNETLPLGLKSLRDLKFSGGDHETTPKGLLTLLKLPSIRRIQLGALGDLCELDSIDAAYSTQSSVTHLCLGLGPVMTQALGRILPMIRALKHFSYTGGPGGIDLAAFGLALKACRGTLQQLRVSFPFGIYPYYGTHYTDRTIGSLRDWPVLMFLRCPLSVLLDHSQINTSPRLVDVLPAVINDFRIGVDSRWVDSQIVDQVVQVMELKNWGGFGGLTRVTIRRMGNVQQQRLRVACEAAGVELRRC